MEACSVKAWEGLSVKSNRLDVELKRLRSPTVTSTLRNNSDRYVVASRDLRQPAGRKTETQAVSANSVYTVTLVVNHTSLAYNQPEHKSRRKLCKAEVDTPCQTLLNSTL